MRKWNKFFAILCALMLILGSMSLGSFAEDEPTEQEIAQQEEAAQIAAEEEAARIAAEEAVRKAAEEEAARKAAEEEAAKKAAEEEAARKAAEEEAAKKAEEAAVEEKIVEPAEEEVPAEQPAEEVAEPVEVEAPEQTIEAETAEETVEVEAPAEPAEEDIPEQEAEEAEEKSEFEISDKALVKYNGESAEVTVPDGVEEIGEKAFAGNDKIEKVILPDSVEIIAESAFENCVNLKQVAKGNQSKLAKIEKNAFKGDKKLDTSFAEGVEEVSELAFEAVEKAVAPAIVEVAEETAEEEIPAVEEVAVEEIPAIEEVAVEEIPAVEEVTEEEIPAVEEITVEEESAVEEEEIAEQASGAATVVLKESRAAVPPTIEEQPQNVTDSVVGQSVTVQVKAAGTNLGYAWYYKRSTDSEFRKWNNQTSSTLTFTMRADWEGIQIYSVVTDGNGLTVTTDTVTVTTAAPVITVQPQDVEDGAAGASSTISLTATGSGLTYAWYYKFATEGASWTKWNNQTSNTLTFTAKAAWENMSVKCIVTDQLNRTVESDVVIVKFTKPEITVQPVNITDSAVGNAVNVSLEATGADLSYAWYYKRPIDTEFKKWNNQTSDTLTFTMREDWDGIQIYGLVTDKNGTTAKSDTIKVEIYSADPEITVQPQDVEDGAAGVSSTISLTAIGRGLTYEWYYKFATAGASWTKWNNQTSNTLTFTAKAAWENMSVKCIVTDKQGRTVESDVVIVKFTKPEITVQPVNITDSAVGNAVNVSLEATGADLTYAWYYKRPIDTEFRKWNNQTSDTLTFTMREDWDGIQIYSVVTDKNGTTAMSDTIKVEIYSADPEITVQPQDVEDGAAGVSSTISLTAIGKGLTYEWYYKFATEGASWTKWNNQTSNTLTFAPKASWENMSVKCIVTDKQGRTVESDVVIVKFTKPEITVQPVNITDSAVGNAVNVSLEATGADLTYAWYYKRPIDTEFRKWNNQTSDTLTFTMREDWDGIQIYSVVTDKNGTTAMSDTIKVEIYSADPEITVQPQDVEDGAIGVQSTISLTAIGRGLTYEWYYKFATEGASWTKWNNQTSNTLTFAPKASWENMSVKCIVTDKKGRTVESDVVTVKFTRPEITIQPTSITDSAEGNTVNVSLTATGADLTYAWYYKRPIDTEFRKWNNQTSDTLTFTMREDWDGIQLYSVVTDKNGMTATSDTIKVEIYSADPEITVQPQDVEDGAIGVQSTISLTAIGRGLTYEWYYKFATEGASWTKWNNQTSNTLTFAPNANWENMSVKCIVTDKKGRTVESNVVTVKFEWPEIIEQPTFVIDGITVTASLQATGKSLTYAWYYKLPGEGTEWKQWNNKTEASLTFDIRAAWEDIQVYAVATDVNGMFTESEPVTISYTEFTLNDVEYEIIEKGADISIKHYNGTAASVVIPEQSVGYTVKEVGEEAFMNNTTLTSIDLPDTITIIRARAFKGCTNLREMK